VEQTYKSSKLAFSDINCNRKLGRIPRSPCAQCRICPSVGLPQMLPRAPLMVIYKNKLCNATSPGRMDFKTKYSNCRHSFSRTRPVARFWGLGGKIHFYGGKILIFITCLKQIFLSTTKFGGHKKDLGVTVPECPCVRAWAEPSPESLPLGTFMFVQRG